MRPDLQKPKTVTYIFVTELPKLSLTAHFVFPEKLILYTGTTVTL